MFFTPNLNVDDIIMRITAAMPDVEIEAGNTCFIFDEIQDCPRARGSLKFHYYHKNGGIELDFLMRYKGQCVPIECKATTGNAKSMRTVLGHPEKYHVDYAIKLGDYNVGKKDKLLTLPMYMAFLLKG